jgi:hypothetical protein
MEDLNPDMAWKTSGLQEALIAVYVFSIFCRERGLTTPEEAKAAIPGGDDAPLIELVKQEPLATVAAGNQERVSSFTAEAKAVTRRMTLPDEISPAAAERLVLEVMFAALTQFNFNAAARTSVDQGGEE